LTLDVTLRGTLADLPAGCEPLNEVPFSTENPTTWFEANNELQDVAPPSRIGSWRSQAAIPTQHFAINQCKPGAAPMRLMPYEAVMSNEGITYDAYTLDRWSVSTRSDEMQQQTPSRQGAPWDKVTSLGTNMKQLVSGPDGNPTAEFTGRSGVRVGIQGSTDPVWSDFGDMYADFTFSDGQGGRMEAALVRGSALLAHRFQSANPVLYPWCLSRVNGVDTTLPCPAERDATDGGEGFLEGSCSGGTLTITLHTTKPVSLSSVQWAANTLSNWATSHVMNTCSTECTISSDGRQVTVRVPGASGVMAFATNIVGKYVVPSDWINNPATSSCNRKPLSGSKFVDVRSSFNSTVADVVKDQSATSRLALCTDLPNLSPCTSNFCKQTACEAASGGLQDFRLIMQLDAPISGIDQVQIAVNTADQWAQSHPMITCTPAKCTLQSDRTTLIYCDQLPEGVVNYAVNVMGRFVQPPTNWEDEPFQHQCGGSGTDIDVSDRFVLELNEPNNAIPGQTRKFVVYFSEPMRATADANGLTFVPASSGSKFSGLMQLGYAGSTTRGDVSAANFFDAYRGVYSYHPKTSYCADNNRGYINFDWNKYDVNGQAQNGQLLMITMPHHETLLQDQGSLITTPFTYRGFVGNSWLLSEDLPEASMAPDPSRVNNVINTPEWNQNIVAAIERDANGQDLNGICESSDSYGVGKAISMVARLASISRAFGTSHYNALDQQIGSCLDKWLRIDDTLSNAWKFRYDTVYGGLLLRSGPDNEPINPAANFGFPLYSDHHFHLGYFLYAMGYYATHYPAWAQANRGRIVAIARDVGNPSFNDVYFPIVRNKDFYVGISWATGVVGGLRQAESSTEAINCYHGLAALGLALGDNVMKSVGQIMLATEIRSVREYYHVRTNNRRLFPSHILQYGTIGQFAEDAIFYYTLNWPCDPPEFPMRHACLVGIQVIPIMSISRYFMDQEWANAVNNVCTWSINPWLAPGADLVDQSLLKPVSLGWGAFCHAATAPLSVQAQQAAADYVKDLSPGQLVGGTGAASTLLFIYGAT